MYYNQLSSPPGLAQFVKYFWILENNSIPAGENIEVIFPDGCPEIIFHYGDRFIKYDEKGDFEPQSYSIAAGQLSRFIKIGSTGKTGMIAAKFHPAGVFPVLGCSLDELSNQTYDLNLILGKEGRELEEKIRNAANAKERLKIFSGFLLGKLNAYTKSDSVVSQALNTIESKKGNISILKMAKDLSISSKHLERKFRHYVGLTPKEFSKILRFRNAISLIKQDRIKSFSLLACEAGYYDQSHFIRDFQKFTGTSPQKYFSTASAFSDFINS